MGLLTQTFIFREPRNEQELETLLRIRYKVFLESKLHFLIQKNANRLDIDEFDFYSIFVGIFLKNGNQEVPIGSVRMITETKSRFYDWLKTKSKIKQMTKKHLFHLNKCSNDKESIISDFITENKHNGLKVSEISRFSVAKDFVNSGVSLKFIEAFFVFMFNATDVALIIVNDDIAPVYERYGFQPIENALVEQHNVRGQPLFITQDKMTPRLLTKYDKMKTAYQQANQICYHTEQPNNYDVEKYQTATQNSSF